MRTSPPAPNIMSCLCFSYTDSVKILGLHKSQVKPLIPQRRKFSREGLEHSAIIAKFYCYRKLIFGMALAKYCLEKSIARNLPTEIGTINEVARDRGPNLRSAL
jgi:hypothetical protein